MNILQRTLDTDLPTVSDNPVLDRIYKARGIHSADDLNYSFSKLPSPFLLTGMKTMVDYLEDAFDNKKKIVIVGDFDADGATSCAVGLLGLKMLGFPYVDFLVPDRFKHGYGLTTSIVQESLSKSPDILLTVDNGISSFEGVNLAKQLGLTVLVTDHHLPSEELPDAHAIVNPNLKGDRFPSRAMAGVGVMFYVLGALMLRLKKHQKLSSKIDISSLLDLVALGTVADLVPLDGVNRIFVYNGLKQIKELKGRPGINALLSVAGKDISKATETDFGFAVGPRLNAAGRMDDMSIGISCLIAKTNSEARELATKLNDFNVTRRFVEEGMKADALSFLNEDEISDKNDGLCLFNEDWHQGVIGILASRIKDLTYKPVIAFAPGDEGYVKGSARSIPGIHIRDALSNIAKDNPDILSKFGGHAMAAGLSIKAVDLSLFTRLFDNEIKRLSQGIDLTQTLYTDGQLDSDDLTLELASILITAGPFGQGFPEPCFEGVFKVTHAKVLKEKHVKFMLRTEKGKTISAIKFNVEDPYRWSSVPMINTVYKLSVNEFRGESNVQLMLDHIEASKADSNLRHEFLMAS